VGKLINRTHEDPSKGNFAYHAVCLQMMDEFTPDGEGTYAVCAIGHCKDEQRTLFVCDRVDEANGAKCPLVYCKDCFKNYDSNVYDGIRLEEFQPTGGKRIKWRCPVCRGTPLHPRMAWPNMQTLLTYRDKFINEILREERDAAADKRNPSGEGEEGGCMGTGEP